MRKIGLFILIVMVYCVYYFLIIRHDPEYLAKKELRSLEKTLLAEYTKIKEDKSKLDETRRRKCNEAIIKCRSLLDHETESNIAIKQLHHRALVDALTALENGQIGDGIPRLICARLTNPTGIKLIWIESDYDTTAIILSPENSTYPTVRYYPFDGLNIELASMFSYFRYFEGETTVMNNQSEDPSVLGIQEIRSTPPRFSSVGYPFRGDIEFQIPTVPVQVWIEDAKGHISNQLQLLREEDLPVQTIVPIAE